MQIHAGTRARGDVIRMTHRTVRLRWGLAPLAALAVIAAMPPTGALAAQPDDRSQPAAPSAWATTVAAFANALVEEPDAGGGRDPASADAERDAALTRSFLADLVAIRQFNRQTHEDVAALRRACAGMSPLSARAYTDVPPALASDVAADVRDAKIPERAKRRLTAADAADARRADETAARWVATTLEPARGDPIGVIVLWPHADLSAATDAADADADDDTDDDAKRLPTPLFILVKGQPTSDGAFRIRQIFYGDPLPRMAR